MVKFKSEVSGFQLSLALVVINFHLATGLFSLDNLDLFRNAPQNDKGRQIRLVHCTGFDINSAMCTYFSVDNAEEVVTHIDPTKPMALYIHGFRESLANESISTIVDAYLRRGDQNLVLVDWTDYAYDSYTSALVKVQEIAKIVATILNEYIAQGLPSEALHIVGHSMGAQMAGFIGKYTNFVVPRITGLDPASPGYYQFRANHLSPNDARFVDVIHTDGGLYGALPSTGTVDCYPNGGSRPQPGCPLFGPILTPTDLCSHWRSWRFWAESLLNERAFLAVKCTSYSSFLAHKCNKQDTQYCGFIMPETARGSYYLSTNARSPFGKGIDGTVSK